LASLTGYTLTRGVLCAMRRPVLPTVEKVTHDARRVAVIDGVTDTTNIGAIFRSAAALGVDAVLLTPTSCDPLNRRAVRVSMGSVFLVPWTFLPHGNLTGQLRALGLTSVALALTNRSVPIDYPALKATPRLAMILGTEGDGLADEVIDTADFTARIPMSHGVDSLNVAAASALAFWELRTRTEA
ncbi:MAG: RNA methyltransferase, partial [Paramuribaculum sp.]|nr:RNA methyltransferase [Paramuribaculum sp.]